MATSFLWHYPIIILPFLKEVLSSIGNRSPFYNECVRLCKAEFCDAGKQPIFDHYTFGFGFSIWSCLENCKYDCQWKTVEGFLERNWKVPQFNGKWPFVRLFGCQEPASAFFSIMNFLFVLKSYILFKEKVSKSSCYYYVWSLFALVQLNSWFWSTVYHTRDTVFTEKMDYMSAFAFVLYSFYGAGLRIIGTSVNLKTVFWSIFCGSLCINHLAYIWLFKFDYNYNMKLNILVGSLTLLLWLAWGFLNYKSRPHVWKVFLFVFLAFFTSIFELLDFPPILWLFDAHSLWHGSSIFVINVFFKFVIEDCIFLENKKHQVRHKKI